jgi:hypothetical protein
MIYSPSVNYLTLLDRFLNDTLVLRLGQPTSRPFRRVGRCGCGTSPRSGVALPESETGGSRMEIPRPERPHKSVVRGTNLANLLPSDR